MYHPLNSTLGWRLQRTLLNLGRLLRCLNRTGKRISGHIFITLLAYHLVQTLRLQLKSQCNHDSWQTLWCKMENQQRLTATFSCKDDRTLHLRKATRAEPEQKEIHDALGLATHPGGTQQTISKNKK